MHITYGGGEDEDTEKEAAASGDGAGDDEDDEDESDSIEEFRGCDIGEGTVTFGVGDGERASSETDDFPS